MERLDALLASSCGMEESRMWPEPPDQQKAEALPGAAGRTFATTWHRATPLFSLFYYLTKPSQRKISTAECVQFKALDSAKYAVIVHYVHDMCIVCMYVWS